MPIDMGRLARFPLWPVVDGKCGCPDVECNSKPGKHPIFRWKGMGTSEKMSGPEGCGYGIATGTRSGLFVVDLDGDAAMQWWADQCEGRDVDPWVTYSVDTARGCHLYFNQPDFPVKNSASAIAKGVDVRGEGGYVCAPGTVHVSGHVYAEHDATAQILDAPAWLLECPGLRGSMRDMAEEGENAPVAVDVNTPLGMERLRAGALACATMPASVQGENGSMALWSVAMKLMRELELPVEAALELVESVYNPRCSPPWETDLILHKLENARDLSDKPTGPGKTDEEHDAFVARLKATARGLRPNVVPTRRCKNPSHVYTFCPGKDTSAMAKEPIARLLVDVTNTLTTHRDWDGALQWDLFKQRIVAVDPPMRMNAETDGLSDADIFAVRAWLECHGSLLQKGEAFDVIHAAAKQVSFHPVKEYLESCRAARVPGILDDAAAWLFGSVEPLAQEFFKKMMVGAVRRIYNPGVQMDTMLVLTGKQGARKSTFVRELFGAHFTRSQMPDLDNKDASLAVQGFWGVELAELDKIMRAGNETVLEFLTRRVDDFRSPYARCESHVPRACVFIGTTNTDDFLRDSNGHRRYWPIVANKVDLTWLLLHRDAMWGEALALAEEGYEHWFDDESVVKAAHEPFVTHDPWHELVRAYLHGREKVTCEAVFRDAVVASLEVDMTKFTKAAQMSITDTLKRLGCERKKTRGPVLWVVPAELAQQPMLGLSPTQRWNRDRS